MTADRQGLRQAGTDAKTVEKDWRPLGADGNSGRGNNREQFFLVKPPWRNQAADLRGES